MRFTPSSTSWSLTIPSDSVEKLLSEYEAALSDVMTAGINIVTQNYTQNWDYLQSVFFSTTILTTIGPALFEIINK